MGSNTIHATCFAGVAAALMLAALQPYCMVLRRDAGEADGSDAAQEGSRHPGPRAQAG